MVEVLPQSWTTKEQLDNLARLKRENKIVSGVITSVTTLTSKVLEDGKYVNKDMEVAVFLLEGGITAYCPATEFDNYQYKSLAGFTGTFQDFIIDYLNLDDGTVTVSVKKAAEIKKQQFYAEIEKLQSNDTLQDHLFEGTVWGFNPSNRRIHVRVNGADCFMLPNDWSWDRGRRLEQDVQRGEVIQVKVLRFDKERNLVQVSRRHTIEDPYKKLQRLMDSGATIAGQVSGVHPVHGIFVKLEEGVEAKAIKPSHLEEPIVGDIVTCVIRSIDQKARRIRVVITRYPRGKKHRKDVGSFLFE
ncbi:MULTISPECIES: S1 RNA-binding domain-containing protein [Bacillati]|uniref:S1 RNA-binding domain-containing protein n=1 Tax=Bacillati TaxID=1783272 RepID=UPI0022B97C87|nr:S1 RNA-binding domain-containing protein [Caldifermentibacillus hisashii]